MNPYVKNILTTWSEERETETHLCTRLGDRSKVVDQVGLGHTNTSITDGETFVVLVRSDADVKLLPRVEDGRIGQRRVTNFIESIGAVGDKFSQEDLLVGVEGVWDEGQQRRRRETRRTY